LHCTSTTYTRLLTRTPHTHHHHHTHTTQPLTHTQRSSHTMSGSVFCQFCKGEITTPYVRAFNMDWHREHLACKVSLPLVSAPVLSPSTHALLNSIPPEIALSVERLTRQRFSSSHDLFVVCGHPCLHTGNCALLCVALLLACLGRCVGKTLLTAQR
jgi:hypothetical protein